MEDRRDTDPPSSVNQPRDRNSEPYIGGADAVQKPSYSADVHGAEARGDDNAPGGVTATVPSRGGLGPLGWVVLVIAALVFAAYAVGLFT
jgi:hypothetical protein